MLHESFKKTSHTRFNHEQFVTLSFASRFCTGLARHLPNVPSTSNFHWISLKKYNNKFNSEFTQIHCQKSRQHKTTKKQLTIFRTVLLNFVFSRRYVAKMTGKSVFSDKITGKKGGLLCRRLFFEKPFFSIKKNNT